MDEDEQAAFSAAAEETDRIIHEAPDRRNDPALPIFQLAGRERIEKYRKAFEASADSYWVLLAIRVCANHDLVMPEWLARAYIRAFDTVHTARAKSWDDVFGKPYPKGAHLSAVRQRMTLRWQVLNHVNDIKAREPKTPTDAALFERVGEALGIGKTQAETLYYEAKRRVTLLK